MTEKQLLEIIELFHKKYPVSIKKNKEHLKELLISEIPRGELFDILEITSERTILELFVDEDTNYELREEIAKNRNVPEDILDVLAKDPIIWIKLAVADNVSTSTATLQHIARYSTFSAAKSSAKIRLARRKNRTKSEVEQLVRGEATFSLKDFPYIVLDFSTELTDFNRFEFHREYFYSENDYPRPHTIYLTKNNGNLFVSRLSFEGSKCYVILFAEIEKVSVNEYKIIKVLNEYFDFDELELIILNK